MTTNPVLPRDALALHHHEFLSALKAFGVKRAGVFGSTARGTDHLGSDLDLIVEFHPGASPDLVTLSAALSDISGISVDVVDADQVFERVRRTGIGASILQDTIPL